MARKGFGLFHFTDRRQTALCWALAPQTISSLAFSSSGVRSCSNTRLLLGLVRGRRSLKCNVCFSTLASEHLYCLLCYVSCIGWLQLSSKASSFRHPDTGAGPIWNVLLLRQRKEKRWWNHVSARMWQIDFTHVIG